MLEFRTFGTIELEWPDGRRSGSLLNRPKRLALLAVLSARSPGEAVHRSRLISLLWPESAPSDGRAALNTTLSRLRRDLGAELFRTSSSEVVGLAPAHIRSDVGRFVEAVKSDHHRAALELHRGRFLDGFCLDDNRPFEEWVEKRRGTYRRWAYRSALRAGDTARAEGELAVAEEAYRDALDLAPVREEAAERLVRTLAEAGHRSDAIQLLDRFLERQREELGLAPSESFRDLEARLRRASGRTGSSKERGEGEPADTGDADVVPAPSAIEVGAASASGRGSKEGPSRIARGIRRGLIPPLVALALVAAAGAGTWYMTVGDGAVSGARGGARSVAVLPFDTPGRGEPGTVARALHEDLFVRLLNISGLTVVSRSSVGEHGRTSRAPADVARKLGVKWIVDGEVHQSNGRIRVDTRLLAPRPDTLAWSASYNRPVTPRNLSIIQSAIAERIATSLGTRISPAEHDRVQGTPTQDLAAYEAFLRGRSLTREYLGRWDVNRLNRGIENLRRAVESDSTFARAHAWLGFAIADRAVYSVGEARSRWLNSATAAVERAYDLQPDLATAHLARGHLHQIRGSSEAELRAYRRAASLQPSNALARTQLSETLVERGEYVEAVRTAREAVRLGPRRPWVLQEMADQLRAVGLYEAAAAWDRHIMSIDPAYFGAHNGLAHTNLLRGRPERALAVWEEYLGKVSSPPPAAWFFAATAALAADVPGQAGKYLDRLPEALASQATRASPDPRERSTGRLAAALGSVFDVYRGLTELRLGRDHRGRELLRSTVDTLQRQIAGGEGLVDRKRAAMLGALASLGEQDVALRELERLAESSEASHHPLGFRWNPLYDSLRQHPRVQQLVRSARERQERHRNEIRGLDLDLYPPGAQADDGS